MRPGNFNCMLLGLGVVISAGMSSGSILKNKQINFLEQRSYVIFNSSSAQVSLFRFRGDVGHSFSVNFYSEAGEPKICEKQGAEVCLAWGTNCKLSVIKQYTGFHKVELSSTSQAFIPEICFDIRRQHLYGGPIKKFYPQEKTDFDKVAYISADYARFNITQGVAERYWYTSSGMNIHVDPKSPLFVMQNKEKLCLIANNTFPYTSELPIKLSYETCIESRNLRCGLMCYFPLYKKPIPPPQVISSPIWSSWVGFKKDISQNGAITFFNDIRSHNMRVGVMEIDDDWETCYGSQIFNEKFPDPKAMVDLFHKEGVLTTLWVHPFVDPGCKSIDQYMPYLCKYPNGTVGKTDWWNGKEAYLINFTDPNAIKWYELRLLNIQRLYGFDSFKFDGGEAAFIPGMSYHERLTKMRNPNEYTRNYVKVAEQFGSLAEVRVGANTQNSKVMLRLLDTNSIWGVERWGLRTVIPSVLQLSLHGYGAILPDMIGGNSYEDKPTKELFIRWIQLSTFFPVMQFSLAPWVFDQETVDIAKKFIDLHYKYKDRFMNEFQDQWQPVINPIWWADPEDEVAQVTDDEFLLGETLLVAPVVEEGAVSRDIYLPLGKWRDANTGTVHIGCTWLQGYNAPLDVLPYFERLGHWL